jgi:hypothetical protein
MSGRNMPLNTMYTGSQIFKGFIEVVLAYIAEDIFRLCADLFVCTQDDKQEPGCYDEDSCGRPAKQQSLPCIRNTNTLGVPLRRIGFRTISTN